MKIEIEFSNDREKVSGFTVTTGDKSADHLSFEEMLGLVAAITIPDTRRCLQWLQTQQQREAREARFQKSANRQADDTAFG